VKKLIGLEGRLFISEVEIAVGQGTRASSRDEGKFGIVGEKGGRRIGGRACVDDVAAKSSAVLVRNAAGPTGGLAQDGEFVSNDGVFADVGEGGAGSNDDGIGSGFDEAELFEIPERDELLSLKAACPKSHHDLGAAGDGGVAVGRVSQNLEDCVERIGSDQFIVGDVGAHYFVSPAWAICWTALKMRM